jgi:hypothetical protein
MDLVHNGGHVVLTGMKGRSPLDRFGDAFSLMTERTHERHSIRFALNLY